MLAWAGVRELGGCTRTRPAAGSASAPSSSATTMAGQPRVRRQGGRRPLHRHRCRRCAGSSTPSGQARNALHPRAASPTAAPTGCVPELVAEVAFSEWTTDGKLRHPRFEGLRTDKAAGDVQRERPAGAPGAPDERRGSDPGGAPAGGVLASGRPAPARSRRNSGCAVRCLTPSQNREDAARSGLVCGAGTVATSSTPAGWSWGTTTA